MSSDGGGIAYLIAGFLGGLWFIYSGTRKYLLVQKIKNTPTSKADAAAVGLVELYGRAKCLDDKTRAEYYSKYSKVMDALEDYKKNPEFKSSAAQIDELSSMVKVGAGGTGKEAFLSPISKSRCAFWKIVAEYYRSGKHGGWRPIYTSCSYDPFFIEDETGRMLVDPKGSEVDIPRDNLFEGYISGKGIFGVGHQKMDTRVLDFISSLGAGAKPFMEHQNENVRVFEYFIAEDDMVYALGTAEPREGVSSAIGSENLIVRKGKSEKTMYISDSGERKILEKISGNMYWYIFGGFALSLFCGLALALFIANLF